MTFQIDNAFNDLIKTWHPRYDLIEDDEKEYERLVASACNIKRSVDMGASGGAFAIIS